MLFLIFYVFGSISSLCHFLISHCLLHFAYCSYWSCLMIGYKTPSYLHTYHLACFSDKVWTLIRRELPNYQELRLSVLNWWPLLWLRNQAVTTQRVQTEEGPSSCKTWMKDTASTDRSEERGWQRACSRSGPVLLAVGIGLKQSNTSLATSCLYCAQCCSNLHSFGLGCVTTYWYQEEHQSYVRKLYAA